MQTYVAFLRGINVGGNTLIKMVDLKAAFEKAGFQDVKTVLASGNIVFDSSEHNFANLTEKAKKTINEAFKLDLRVVVRTKEDIEELVAADPFKDIPITKETRLYVTFLGDPESIKESTLTIPFATPDKAFQILRLTESEVCSALVLSEDRGTLDLMGMLEKEYGKNVTTRNWNTIMKIIGLLSAH